VWTDEGIEPGTLSWKEAIEHAIRETGILVVLLSPTANESVWVQREIDYAETQEKSILPILVKGKPKSAVPFALAGSQFIDLRNNYENGIKKLLKRCWHDLPSHAMNTFPAQMQSTYVNQKTKRKRFQQNILAGLALVGLMGILIAGLFISNGGTQTPLNNTETPEPTSHSIANSAPIEILYNRDTLVIHNQSNQIVSLYNLVFEQENTVTRFESSDWLNQTLQSRRCVQIWTINISYLSADTPPADVCNSRVAYRATLDTFWVSNNPDTQFVIRRGTIVVGTCTTADDATSEMIVCLVDL